MLWWKKIFGDESQRYLKRLAPLVEKINQLEPELTALAGGSELLVRSNRLRERARAGESFDALLPEAFALVREAARRTLGQRHYDVQLLGGMVLHQGKIAEMKTGEGKTLVATLPAYLNALSSRGVHIITVNDYLSRRDGVWMGQIYATLGLSVGVINHDVSYLYDPEHKEVDAARDAEGAFHVFHQFLKPVPRALAYAADVVYGTNNEFGFDYLRDNLAQSANQLVQLSPVRPRHHFAIIDEVDSVLIDEARTPLIISGPVDEADSLYAVFTKIAANLQAEADYTVDEKQKTISLTDEGITKAEKMLGGGSIYTELGLRQVFHLETAVRARALYQRDRDYVVKGGEVVIVDEFTGRLQPGRRWSDGLHQAIEAKEGVRIREESRTYASITLPNYFKLYERLAGMTGTALTSAEEFTKVYGLQTVAVPTHRSSARQDLNDLVFQTEKGKMTALARRIKEAQGRGQPVLVGTISIEKNELFSGYLRREGVRYQMLNAKNHEEEGQIIAGAGQRGSVVVATNMAGRGVDIKLGGALATPAVAEEVKKLGGLLVLGTERHEARRIDNQLRGRAGRQGDPGATQFYISLEDYLARVFAGDRVKKLMGRFGIPEDEPIENRLVSRSIESAQAKIEGVNFDRRRHLLEYDNVLNTQRTAIYRRRNQALFGLSADLDELLAGVSVETVTEHKQRLGQDTFYVATRQAVLAIIDRLWMDHLESMDYLKNIVSLRAYGQRDPLIEYQKEGLRLFKELEENLRQALTEVLTRPAAPRPIKINLSPVNPAVKSTVNRNDPCPCGSGKKYKKCGLLNTSEHQQNLSPTTPTSVA
ncbi:MAG: preprotein translocase subunit SecA [Patescibacteria group bacterium]